MRLRLIYRERVGIMQRYPKALPKAFGYLFIIQIYEDENVKAALKAAARYMDRQDEQHL